MKEETLTEEFSKQKRQSDEQVFSLQALAWQKAAWAEFKKD